MAVGDEFAWGGRPRNGDRNVEVDDVLVSCWWREGGEDDSYACACSPRSPSCVRARRSGELMICGGGSEEGLGGGRGDPRPCGLRGAWRADLADRRSAATHHL
eukprot:scaffold26484_cov132-Isochrysis_galbana.AAC.1